MRLGGGLGARLRSRRVGLPESSGRSGNRLSPSPSLFHPQTGVGRSGGLGAERDAGQVERAEASGPEGLAPCAAEQVLDLAEGWDLGQTLVGGPERTGPARPGSCPQPGSRSYSEPRGRSLEAKD